LGWEDGFFCAVVADALVKHDIVRNYGDLREMIPCLLSTAGLLSIVGTHSLTKLAKNQDYSPTKMAKLLFIRQEKCIFATIIRQEKCITKQYIRQKKCIFAAIIRQ